MKQDMTTENNTMSLHDALPISPRTVEVTKKYLKALRQAVGLQIEPETAEVEWIYAQTLDPYGDYPDLPDEYDQVGSEYIARYSGSDVCIYFGDLPEATRTKLWE